ncbi:GNAT family N-acetyltransferase [Clostridium oryzae]|uniref:GNAT family N-acetyltransferase n=1 Tax=Clostridium oryzae TaxID=1450648 RepID=UPI0009A50E84|nr:GNAT family N-acetyltransferase [Clostridium oryzae]
MKFRIVPNNREYAQQMIDKWKYDGEYAIYDYANEAEELLEEKSWGSERFAVLDDKNELIGELTVEFFRSVGKDSEDDGYVEIETVRNNPEAAYEMWIGFGLKPELTGKGIGKQFVTECINFAVDFHKYRGQYVRLGVAKFNQRAEKVYKRVGFSIFDSCEAEIDGKKIEILWMRKRLW